MDGTVRIACRCLLAHERLPGRRAAAPTTHPPWCRCFRYRDGSRSRRRHMAQAARQRQRSTWPATRGLALLPGLSPPSGGRVWHGHIQLCWSLEATSTEASPDAVLAFYRPELAALGWKVGGGSSAIPGRHESKACGWFTNDFVFRLSFWKSDKFVQQYPGDAPHTTVYELRLIGHGLASSNLACTPR